MKRYRPLHTEYAAIARVIRNDHHLNMTVDEFVSNVQRYTYGELTEKRIKEIYYALMKEISR
jgi:hypothetical protein